MSHPENYIPRRNVLQIVDTQGNAYKAFVTENIWLAPAFSFPARSNAVTPYFNDKAYSAELITAFSAAKESIYTAGWQINRDVQLAPRVRLYDWESTRKDCLGNGHPQPTRAFAHELRKGIWNTFEPEDIYQPEKQVAFLSNNTLESRG